MEELLEANPELGLALQRIGVDLSELTPSQRKFLLKSTVRLLERHDPQWIKENSRILRERFDLLKNDL